MIKMVTAKATTSGATHELRREFYEKYKEDFAIIKEYEVMDDAELKAKAETKVVEEKVVEEKAKPYKGK